MEEQNNKQFSFDEFRLQVCELADRNYCLNRQKGPH